MADKDNCPTRLTRAAARKVASASASSPGADRPPNKRKRVALRELPNAFVPPASPTHHPPKPKSKPRAKEQSPRSRPAVENAASADGDDSEVDDQQMCSTYASDVYQYLRSMEAESKRRPLANYVHAVQRNVTANMRGVLVDWLVEVAEEYKLVSDTLFLAVSYIDRFLSSNAINYKRLQLLGVSSMLIASKYEEISPPNVEDFCYITDNTYTKQEVVIMESEILKFLKFEMGNPTIKTFLRRFTQAGQEDGKYSSLQFEFLGSYLAELSLVDYGCVQFLPSVIAASVVFIARFTIDPNSHPWNKKLEQCTGYRMPDLKDCIHAVHDLQLKRKASSLVAISEKYKQRRFKCVSMLLSPSMIPAIFMDEPKE